MKTIAKMALAVGLGAFCAGFGGVVAAEYWLMARADAEEQDEVQTITERRV
jgi:hypothetical protein